MATRKSTRAASGSGLIRERKNKSGKPTGKWEAQYTAGRDPGTGKQIRKSIYGNSQDEVRRKLNAVIKDIDDGTYSEPDKMTVGAWLDIWLSDYTISIKPATLTTYKHYINKHIKPALGAINLQRLNTHTVQGFYIGLTKSGRILQKGQKKEAPPGLSAKTIKNIHAILHTALKQAVANSYIKTNPAASCSLPRVDKKQMMILQGEQIPAFINAVAEHRYKAIFLTTLFCGTRRGETLGITWDSVDFQGGTILIDKQLQRRDGRQQLVPVKNDKPRRIEPPATVFQILREHKSKQFEKQLLAGQLWEKSGLVFTNDLGGALDSDAVYKAFKTMLTDNGLPNIRMHDLRHTAATLMLQNGDSIKAVQEALGHGSAGFTLDTYGHVTTQMKKDSADRMEAYIQGLKIPM
jgi:integrase